jgi:hypothetical protein
MLARALLQNLQRSQTRDDEMLVRGANEVVDVILGTTGALYTRMCRGICVTYNRPVESPSRTDIGTWTVSYANGAKVPSAAFMMHRLFQAGVMVKRPPPPFVDRLTLGVVTMSRIVKCLFFAVGRVLHAGQHRCQLWRNRNRGSSARYCGQSGQCRAGAPVLAAQSQRVRAPSLKDQAPAQEMGAAGRVHCSVCKTIN